MFKQLVILSVTALLLLTGCESAAEKAARAGVMQYMVGDFNAARATLQPIAIKPDENFVLNNCRLGSADLAVNDLDGAEKAFLNAYDVMNSVGTNDGGRSLGATLVDEKIKIWKGEPFERAMANFYLGLTYYMRQDYNNARGAFENALFKLRDYGADTKHADKYAEVESNFTLGLIMLGKCWQHLGREDLAKANFDQAIKARPQLAALADYDWNSKSNLLLVIDFGYGPRKVTDDDGSIVGFGPTPGQAGRMDQPVIALNGQQLALGGLPQPPVDLLQLAQQRQWQSIDTIRVVKSTLGTGLIVGGAIGGAQARRPEGAAIGLGVMAAGLLLKASSQADVRQWEMLPRTVYILPLQVQPGTYDLNIIFPRVPGLRQNWRNITVPATGEATYYFHPQPDTVGPFTWPPDQTLPVQPVSK